MLCHRFMQIERDGSLARIIEVTIMQALELAGVTVSYRDRGNPELSIVQLTLEAGAMMAVTGRSDIGNRAFFSVLAGIEKPTTGYVRWNETDIASMAPPKRDAWRARIVGLMSRETNLFPGLSIVDNVLLPTGLGRWSGFGFWRGSAALRERASALMTRVGLAEPARLVDGLTRDERRRVALVRMLLKRPEIILADHPTDDLGSDAADEICDHLMAAAREMGATVITFTDDERLIGKADHLVRLRLGRVVSGERAELAS